MGQIRPMASAFRRGSPQAVAASHLRVRPNSGSARPARTVTTTGDGAVARAAMARRRHACCGVEGEVMKVVGEVCRARISTAGLNQLAARRWGSGAAWRGGGRRWWSWRGGRR
jgi:hypothetical protein